MTKPYLPPTCAAAASFMTAFCENCTKPTGADRYCPILSAGMMAALYAVGTQPKEWVSEDDGSCPRCTAFEMVGQCRFLGEKL